MKRIIKGVVFQYKELYHVDIFVVGEGVLSVVAV